MIKKKYNMDDPYDNLIIEASWDKLKDIVLPALEAAGVIDKLPEDYIYDRRPLIAYQQPRIWLKFKDPNPPDETGPGVDDVDSNLNDE